MPSIMTLPPNTENGDAASGSRSTASPRVPKISPLVKKELPNGFTEITGGIDEDDPDLAGMPPLIDDGKVNNLDFMNSKNLFPDAQEEEADDDIPSHHDQNGDVATSTQSHQAIKANPGSTSVSSKASLVTGGHAVVAASSNPSGNTPAVTTPQASKASVKALAPTPAPVHAPKPRDIAAASDDNGAALLNKKAPPVSAPKTSSLTRSCFRSSPPSAVAPASALCSSSNASKTPPLPPAAVPPVTLSAVTTMLPSSTDEQCKKEEQQRQEAERLRLEAELIAEEEAVKAKAAKKKEKKKTNKAAKKAGEGQAERGSDHEIDDALVIGNALKPADSLTSLHVCAGGEEEDGKGERGMESSMDSMRLHAAAAPPAADEVAPQVESEVVDDTPSETKPMNKKQRAAASKAEKKKLVMTSEGASSTSEGASSTSEVAASSSPVLDPPAALLNMPLVPAPATTTTSVTAASTSASLPMESTAKATKQAASAVVEAAPIIIPVPASIVPTSTVIPASQPASTAAASRPLLPAAFVPPALQHVIVPAMAPQVHRPAFAPVPIAQQPVIQPVIQPIMQPIIQPVIRPVIQPIIRPVVQTAIRLGAPPPGVTRSVMPPGLAEVFARQAAAAGRPLVNQQQPQKQVPAAPAHVPRFVPETSSGNTPGTMPAPNPHLVAQMRAMIQRKGTVISGTAVPRTSAGPSAAPGKAAANNAEDEDCAVCLEAPREVALAPCGHTPVCAGCWEKVRQKSNECPICRTPVEGSFII
ncbi:hypothetical protein CEUSTIGMA_g13321.t1 [Chlamydomonas eustigma]|uniref:RING-type domain-containing protein n=1 Tax=Chlamydomonas eustigma TaxID=1157962 RepID=A0A250XS77_9CHLO|nr:hypothetical protein CEUSTIGMA_g13321.t1 [Chlamydomonas eustigma]|eukprot:GAX85905.1 hypothetical protein CEUSTIGMA_g13321.t1 [Chlamydomonas eustigma]